MKDLNYHIEMQVVTPLAVGAGNDNEWVRGIDYVQKDGKVYVLDIQKAADNGIDINRLTELFLKSDEKGISALLGNQLNGIATRVFPLPASTTNPIKSFLRTQLYDKPLVAGSSVKGAIRSALFKTLRTDERDNKDVFGDMKNGTDLMRFIRVGDIEMPTTNLVNTKLFNLRKDGNEWAGGWKQAMQETTANFSSTGFNTLYECVAPNQKGYGTIGMSGNAYSLLLQHSTETRNISHATQKKALMETGIQALFHIINTATRSYLQKEKAFFETYTAERSHEILDCIDRLLAMIPADDSCCLMKMSAGVGFHAITGDWQYEDYDDAGYWEKGKNLGKKKYKSRKIAEYDGQLQLMGFVKIRPMNEQEAVQATEAQQTEHQAAIDDILRPVIAREEACQAAAELAARRQQKREEEKRKTEAFKELIEQAKQLYAEEHWDAAADKAKDALALCPEQQEATQIIERCETEKQRRTYIEQEATATAERFSQPLAEVLKDIVSIGNLLGTTTKWLKVEGHALGVQEFEALLAGVKALPAKEQRNLQKKRKDFVKVMGEEDTQRLFDSLA